MKSKLKIPASFSILGQTISVKSKDDITYFDDNRAVWRSRENTIYLQPASKDTPMPPEMIEQAFCHEVIHCMFDFAERPRLSKDEALVNLLGGLLHQILTTAEYGRSK